MGDSVLGVWSGCREDDGEVKCMKHSSCISGFSTCILLPSARAEQNSGATLEENGFTPSALNPAIDKNHQKCGEDQKLIWLNDGCAHETAPVSAWEDLSSFCDSKNIDSQNSLETESKIFSPLAHLRLRFVSCNSSAEIYGGVIESGLLYMWGQSDRGQCGIVQKYVSSPRYVPIRTKSVSCVHGKQQDGADVCLVSFATNSRGTVALDCDGNVWQWGSIFEQDLPHLEPQRLPGFFPRKVLSVHAGENFFAAKVAACPLSVTPDNSAANRSESQALRQFSVVDSCSKCREDSELRLSKLMERATLSAQSLQVGPHHETEDDSKFCPLGLTLQLSPALTPAISPEATPAKKPNSVVGGSLSLMRGVLAYAGWDYDKSAEISSEIRSCCTMPQDREDIELQFRMAEDSRSRSSGGQFSFVSMDLLPQNLSSSSSEGHTSSEEVLSREAEKKPSFSRSSKPSGVFGVGGPFKDILEPVEVWTWGENNMGQLGLGDYTSRRQPTRVERLVGNYVIKLCTGRFHCAALTSTGEIFLWGSNEFGQIKQADSKTAYIPVLLKVGSQSSVLDVCSGNDFTVILVNGLDSRPAVYYCGRSYDSEAFQSLPDSKNHCNDGQLITEKGTALRLGNVEKLGCAVQLRSFGSKIFGNFFPGKYGVKNIESMETNAQMLSLVFGLVFEELKFGRDLRELHSLATELYQRNIYMMKQESASKLVEETRNRLHNFFLVISSIAANGRIVLSECWSPCKNFGVLLDELLRPCTSSVFRDSFRELSSAYSDLVQMGVFAQLNISETIDTALLRLSMEYALESQKVHRRLKKLMKMPFNHLQTYIDVANSGIELINDVALQDVQRKYVNFWKKLQNELNESIEMAEQTHEFWVAQGKKSLCNSLKRPGRFLLAFYERGGRNAGTIKNLTAHNGSKMGWQKLLLFTDALVVVEKREFHLLMFPLVWIISIQDETKLAVQVLSPEVELNVEFENSGAKTEFVHFVNTAVARKCGEKSTKICLGTSPPLRRKGTYTFSSKHATYPGVTYEGSWVLGKVHGSGKLSWPDGTIYYGKLKEGVMEGFGIYAAPSISPDGQTQNFTFTKGFWEQGQLNGLTVTEYPTGARFEGYKKNDMKCGHGVMVYRDKQNTYIGAWAEDKHHGYGVCSTMREKYLGMWVDGKQQGQGTLVTIDGTFFSGHFEKGVFMRGKMICPDGTQFDGEFNGLGALNGKGTMLLVNKDFIHGWFYGSLMDNAVKITSAVYNRHTTSAPTTPISSALLGMEGDRSESISSGVLADEKWVEIFDSFVTKDLELEPACFQDGTGYHPANSERAWNALAVSIKHLKCFNDKSEERKCSSIWDQLERIPNWQAPWNVNYMKMVRDYCELALQSKSHPLSRLIVGLADVFSSTYAGVAAHPLLLNTGVSELRSIIRRIYEILSLLFPSLPNESDMHEVVLLDVTESRETSLCIRANSETPCSFLEDQMIKLTYSTLFTLYAVSSDISDRHYWQRITLLNSKNDVTLLDFFGVLRQLWPIDLKLTDVVDTPMVCATAKCKYYASAIDTLQRLGSEFCPTTKLQILTKTFEDVTKCVVEYSASPAHIWSMDDLCPVFLYVVVRAQLQRLGAEIQLMEDFLPQMKDMGSIFVMFTTLKACYYQILKEKTGL